ncbi:zinc metalloprotease [Thermococcus gorgonarius]|uniref:Peptidase M54 n=1 Tax=Thermococcus gorgonarius TaxID=71997 RepID=A0A2Z2M5K1_THEGO|nr:peptidase M54 [Thermococcus gorgonarius]ASJ00413.1 peptidase M54 [Thermococcus gorgonarius]
MRPQAGKDSVIYVGATYVGNFIDKEVIFDIFDEANRYFKENDLPIRFVYFGKLEVGPGYLINIPTEEGNVKGYPLEAVIEALYAKLVSEIQRDSSFPVNRIFGLTTFPLVSRNPYFHIYEKFLGIQQEITGMRIMVLSIKPFESDNLVLVKNRVLKGVLHELGHGFGLEHCSNRCVMNPPRDLDDWDGRPLSYCSSCMRNLRSALLAEITLKK